MISKIKTDWLAALRSGDYIQGKGALAKDDYYCCLGVLCDLYIKAQDTDWAEFYYNTDARINETLPKEVVKWAGLSECNPTVFDIGSEDIAESLAGRNDKGATFTELADLIEKYL